LNGSGAHVSPEATGTAFRILVPSESIAFFHQYPISTSMVLRAGQTGVGANLGIEVVASLALLFWSLGIFAYVQFERET
jgi:hypothetical protein